MLGLYEDYSRHLVGHIYNVAGFFVQEHIAVI